METEKIIKEFLTKMATQDNRATAAPYFYVIRTKVSDPAPLDNCDRTCWYWNDSTYDTYEQLEEAVREAGYDKDELANAEEYGVKDRWEKRGMFLTEEDAEQHLKLNHYHYSPGAHTYVDHAWRAPKLKEFFSALNAHFGIEEQQGRQGSVDLRPDGQTDQGRCTMNGLLKSLSPKSIRINQTWFVNGKQHLYVLRISNGESLTRSGNPASMSYYGNKKRISKMFHLLLRELNLPYDRLNWKRIDEGGMRWQLK